MDHCFALSYITTLREDGPAAPSMLGRYFLDFLRVRNRLVAGLPFPPFLTRIAWIRLSRNRFLRIPCSGVHSLGRLFGSIHEAAALKFPRPDEGGGSNLAKFPSMAGNSL
jgi:hypothetical protein